MNEQKTLNTAFIATLVFSGINVVFLLLLSSYIKISLLGLVELVLFPVLGYFTKKRSKIAVKALLVLFIIDRIALLINWSSYLAKPLQLLPPLFITYAFWICFYGAYRVLNKKEAK